MRTHERDACIYCISLTSHFLLFFAHVLCTPFTHLSNYHLAFAYISVMMKTCVHRLTYTSRIAVYELVFLFLYFFDEFEEEEEEA